MSRGDYLLASVLLMHFCVIQFGRACIHIINHDWFSAAMVGASIAVALWVAVKILRKEVL